MAEQFEQEVSVKEGANRLRNRSMPITVLLTDDKEVIRTSIRRLISSDPEVHIVGEATSFRQTIQYAAELKPHIVLMDIHLPDDSAVSPHEMRSFLNSLGTRMIAISFWNDDATMERAQSFGAVTFLDKLTLGTELIPTIKATCGWNEAQA